ncbi:MAG: hypothetical protein MN733_02765, partial [Nitrososphaera sp.]|nr:hypothetical protein [Nitrososphaera sp.]
MTSEIAVMNKTAIALAADSAVTITTADGKKIYNTVNKLFVLSKYRPIGIMIYGNTELIGVPWETLIKTYRQKLSTTHFSTVSEYAKHFLEHLSSSMHLFPEGQQSEYVDFTTGIETFRIRDWIATALEKAAAPNQPKLTQTQIEAVAESELKERVQWLDSLPNLPSVPTNLESSVLTKYRAVIDKNVSRVLKSVPLTATARTHLDGIFARLFTRDFFPSGQHTGVVIAGFGDEELYPSVITNLVSGVVDNTLRYRVDEDRTEKISHDLRAHIIPFAQTDMVWRFLTGVDPDYLDASNKYIEELLTKYPSTVLQGVPNLSPV